MSAAELRSPLAVIGPPENLRTVTDEQKSVPVTVAGLCEDFAPVCASAVDPLEIASALEFDGMNDQIARERYGYPDVFAVADEMYLQVPRQPAEPEPPPDPWQVSRLTPLLHGMLYGLPAVCFPAAAALLGGGGLHFLLVTALLAGWASSQGLASLGYRRLGRTADPAQAKRLLRAGLLAGLALITAIMTVVMMVHHSWQSATVFGIGEGAYMLGACVLLVLGAEKWLLAVLAPGVLGSLAFLALGRPPELEHAVWAVLALPPAGAVAAALWFTRRSQRAKPQPGSPLVTAAELRQAAPAVAFGLVAAGLLAFPVVTAIPGHPGVNTGALLATLPLSLSMGAAEWCMLAYRRRTRALLRSSTDLRAFGRRARLALAAAVTTYLLSAIALTAAAAVITLHTGLVKPGSLLIPELVVYLLLGCAMFLALALQAFGLFAVSLVAGTVALVFELAWRDLGIVAQLVAVTGLLVVLAVYAGRALALAVRHSF